MIMLFIVKEVYGTINHLESAAIFLETRTNRGNRYRKIDLCIKGCLKSKKSASCEIPREIFTVKIESSIYHVFISNSCLFAN